MHGESKNGVEGLQALLDKVGFGADPVVPSNGGVPRTFSIKSMTFAKAGGRRLARGVIVVTAATAVPKAKV